MRSHWLLLALICLLLPLMLVAATPPRPMPGGFKPIPKENIGDPRLKLMAEFAVSMYNLRTHKKLVVERVIRGPWRHPDSRGPELSACRFGQGRIVA
ncbi:cysteine proteinase inhibitor 5-like [Prunus yedoensis var. nudiflora]|uniref:Cysteine proteinase inhibitor 5-like n=1 Tax=Prunus yedoensis var. nudiflora TaxID=2094558 RepID=A0A314UT08_PRUYE|nr:cysteine proteinase inhibitor 5-like [Prunus yedoensis var. nudiflora]